MRRQREIELPAGGATLNYPSAQGRLWRWGQLEDISCPHPVACKALWTFQCWTVFQQGHGETHSMPP